MEIIQEQKLSEEESIKEQGDYLRGTIIESLANPLTGALTSNDAKLIKFHGSYQQHDRDLEKERKQQKLEPLYQFMVRVRATGGIVSSAQWLALDDLSERYANGTLKLTTRQSFQFHGILKRNLKTSIKAIHEALLTTIATCGDVNRNVMCNPNPYQSEIHEEVYRYAAETAEYFKPKTSAYFEIWLGEEKVVSSENTEPLYQRRYLPRKFKIAFSIPPHNDVDVFANDLGFIAIQHEGKLEGFNVCVGGGLGSTFGDRTTYPRLGDVIGYIAKEDILEVAEAIITIQRDFGNRSNRRNARLKYTIDNRGLDWFVNELNTRLRWNIAKARPFEFTTNGDSYGWTKGINDKWFYTLFVEHGRVKNNHDLKLKSALREVAKIHYGDFRLTGNQNLIIGNVLEQDKDKIVTILNSYGVVGKKHITGLRLGSMACVALNTCGLAFAESERYLPTLIDKLDPILRKYNLENESITIRMTGCPNGCARSALGEIGFVGRAVGRYNLYLGASHNGDRLNSLYKEMLSEKEILEALEPILERYAIERSRAESFGDFVMRKEIVSVSSLKQAVARE
jgi:sulfite reductase (NADPH) hemoprotein beta-component